MIPFRTGELITLMIILFICDEHKFVKYALALTRFGYVWVYIHELIE